MEEGLSSIVPRFRVSFVFYSSDGCLSSAGESHLGVFFVGDGRGLEGMSIRELGMVFTFIL